VQQNKVNNMNLEQEIKDINSISDVEAIKNRLYYYTEQYNKYSLLISVTKNRKYELEELICVELEKPCIGSTCRMIKMVCVN